MRQAASFDVLDAPRLALLAPLDACPVHAVEGDAANDVVVPGDADRARLTDPLGVIVG
jgi:hypothetical protein